MKLKWAIGLMVVCCLNLLVTRGWAQAPEAEPGEVVLVGWVLSMDAPNNTFVMAMREYTVPHDKTYRLRTPRAVVVQVPPGTPIHVRWDTNQALTFNDVLPGVNVVVCGPSKGLGRRQMPTIGIGGAVNVQPRAPGAAVPPPSKPQVKIITPGAAPSPGAAPTPAEGPAALTPAAVSEQPLQANNVALWTKVEKGVFSYGPPEPMMTTPAPSGGTLIPLPPIAPSTPKAEQPKAPAGKPQKPAAKSKSRSRR